MERKNGFLTFIFACIPGVGYMYYGLLKKGLEMLVMFILAGQVFSILNLRIVEPIVMIPLWFYSFFDTFNVAARLRRGEYVPDSGFFVKDKSNGQNMNINDLNLKLDKNKYTIIAVILIFLGLVSILNQYSNLEVFNIIKMSISNFMIPALFILGGVYLLIKSNTKKD